VKLYHKWPTWFAVALVAFSPFHAPADEFSNGPLVILVGLSPGGTTDVAARLIGETIKRSSGRTVIVENKPGASGRIAVAHLRNASPDGATLMLAPMAVPVLGPLVFEHSGGAPIGELVPVTQVITFPLAFAVGPDHPAHSIQEFVAWAKDHPSRADFGTQGAGGLPHFFGVMIGQATGINIIHIPYKGLAPLVGDLIGGQIAAVIDTLPDLLELHRAGKLRIIATAGASRSSLTPEVATFNEQGYPSLDGTSWIGVYAPPKTPHAVVENLSALFAAALQTPELREKLIKRGYEPTGTSAGELAAIMAADTARWGPIIKASGFRGD
jgi:tripartite-type tricarboxylate transporter receptor subunit TctC